MKLKFILLNALLGCFFYSNAQSTSAFNNYVSGRYLGFDNTSGTNPLLIKTNSITRMQINGINAGYGVNTSGFIGIGTTVPASPIHIVGSGQQRLRF